MMQTERTVDCLLRWQKTFLGVLMCLLIFLAFGIPKLSISGDIGSFFSTDQPEIHDLRALDDTYSFASGILIMVRPVKDQSFTRKSIAMMRAMEEDAWLVPYVLRVETPMNYTQSTADGDDILIEPLLDVSTELTEQVLEKFHSKVLKSEALQNTLVSPSGHAFGISLQLILPDKDGSSDEVAEYLREMQESWRMRYPDTTVNMVGGLLGAQTLVKAAKDDVMFLIPAAFIAVIVIFFLLLGNFIAIAASLICTACCVIAAYGFAGWFGIVLTAGTAISPLSVIVLISASCVHITLSWMRAGQGGIRVALIDNLGPVIVTNLTTVFGFLCLNFAYSPPLRDMGNIVAFGILFGTLLLFTLFPYVLSFSCSRPDKNLRLSQNVMDRLMHIALNFRKFWCTAFTIAIGVAVIGITQIEFDDNINRYFDNRYEFRRDADAISKNLTGLDTVQISLQAPKGATIFAPEFLRRVTRFEDWLKDQDNVLAVNSITRIITGINKSVNQDDPRFDRIADSTKANAQLMLLYEFSLPPGLDINSLISVDRTQTVLSATIRSDHSKDIRRIAKDVGIWLHENDPNLAATGAAGMSVAFATLSARNNGQMIYGLIVVLCLVSLTMMFTLRSVKFGLISLVPNLVPAILAFGLWWVVQGDVNLGSTIVTTMTFGIVVDDTVHFLMHYKKHRDQGLSSIESMRATFQIVGAAIIVTSVALIAGFIVMTFSGFSINQHVGMLTVFVIGFALLADLLLLPSILITLEGDTK